MKKIKPMKTRIYLTGISLALILFNGCVKDPAVGPRGPQGPQGPAGNANVIGTNAVTVNWTYDSGMNAYTSQINASDITQDIVNTGSVQVFIQYGTEWWVLPDII